MSKTYSHRSDSASGDLPAYGRRFSGPSIVFGALGMVVVVAVFALILFAPGARQPARHPQSGIDDPSSLLGTSHRPIQVKGDGYVSSEKCRKCHEDKYRSWHASYHRKMTQLATPEAVVGDFNNVELHNNGATYHFGSDSTGFWVQRDSPSSFGEPGIVSVTRPVVLTTGSHHMQVYWVPTGRGRELTIVPFVYLVGEQRWIPRSAAFLQPPDSPPETETGRWNRICIGCHTTHGVPRQGSAGFDSEVAEFGIGCEACHGPGEQHVTKMLSSVVGSADDLAIIHPSRLSNQRASQICGLCHSALFDREGEYEYFLEHGRHFRPGDDLSKTRLQFSAADSAYRFWSDGMARVSGTEYNGMSESPCYKRGQLSCLSCHQMHQAEDDSRPAAEWANDQLKLTATDNSACVQCHQDYQDKKVLTAHTHHTPTSSGSNCYNCHMPHTSYGLLKAIRSHQIESPNVSVSQQTGRPMACNLCHLDKTLAWTGQHLEDWYGTEQTELTADEQSIAASLIWALRGDSGQRALLAWHMGWEPAHSISGTDWIGPFLSQLLDDPYDAVRLVAYRSLRRLPGYEQFEYDFIAPQPARREAKVRAMKIWDVRSAKERRRSDRTVLIDAAGKIQMETVRRLQLRRDDRDFGLLE